MASFSVKIDLGLLLGIYEPQVHRYLRTVKDIRNAFAHKSEPINFETQKIAGLCGNIDIDLCATLEGISEDGRAGKIEIDIKPDGTSRTAFLNAIKLLLIVLEMEIKNRPPRVPEPPVFPRLEKSKPSTGKS